jgi:hypothetical protein
MDMVISATHSFRSWSRTMNGWFCVKIGYTGLPCTQPSQQAPPWVGSRSPDGWDQIPRWAGGWACTSHPGVLGSIPKREEPGKTGAPCVKVPGSSRVPVRAGQTHPHRPRLVVSHSTCPPLSSSPHAHSFVIGPAVIKHTHKLHLSSYRVPHGSQPRPGWAPDPLMVGIRSPDGLVVGLAPATLEFWVRFPNERNPAPPWVGSRSLMVGIRSPDGLVVGSCTSHPGVLGSIPKREEPGENRRTLY